MTEQELQAIEARERRATTGPWHYEALAVRAEVMRDGEDTRHHVVDAAVAGQDAYQQLGRVVCGLACTRGKSEREEANGQFIAHARTDVRALVQEVRRLQALVRAAEAPAPPCQHQLRREAQKCRHGLHMGTTCRDCILTCPQCWDHYSSSASYGPRPAAEAPAPQKAEAQTPERAAHVAMWLKEAVLDFEQGYHRPTKHYARLLSEAAELLKAQAPAPTCATWPAHERSAALLAFILASVAAVGSMVSVDEAQAAIVREWNETFQPAPQAGEEPRTCERWWQRRGECRKNLDLSESDWCDACRQAGEEPR